MKAWHEVVKLREDVRKGTLALSEFAADLHAVMTGSVEPQHAQYVNVGTFFEVTHATRSLRHLTAEVCLRLAGKSEKAVRQLAMTYGGGKTHALITLYHLVNDPGALPDLPAVRDFCKEIGGKPVKARVVGVLGDKLDVESGMEVIAPNGDKRRLRQLWSVLAWQIAGQAGLSAIWPEHPDQERDEPPAQGLLQDLLSAAGAPVLILVDELLM